MVATANVNQEKPPVSSLAESLGVEDDDLDLLEDFFIQATAPKSLPGGKIFTALKKGASFGKALGISNDMVEFLYARAHRWVAVARYERAEPIFRTLCIVDANAADFWVGLGICLQARSAWDEALAAFVAASEKKPQWEIPHFHALDLCIRRKDWVKATAELAAFEKKADKETHSAIVAEVNKYKKVLQLQAQRSNGEL
jgi:tetratricopeptide (TPR) repeat protein